MTNMRQQYNLDSSFIIDYFESLGIIGLLVYIVQYCVYMFLVKIKYPQIVVDYPFKPDIKNLDKLPSNDFQIAANVLDQAYKKNKFSVGLMIAQKT